MLTTILHEGARGARRHRVERMSSESDAGRSTDKMSGARARRCLSPECAGEFAQELNAASES
jgi:hypothetical protein